MGLLDSLKGFANRVMKAVKGRLSSSDTKLLEHLLTRTTERNLVLSRGLLTALNIHSPKKADIHLLATMLDNANIRILKKKKPFTEKEERIISKIFVKYGLSKKVASWVASQRDVFLYNQIKQMADASLVEKPKLKRVKISKKFKIKKKKKRKIA